MSQDLTVVLVHRDDYERGQYRAALEALPSVQIVGERSDLRSGLALARQARPTILVLDLAQPVDDTLHSAAQYKLDNGLGFTLSGNKMFVPDAHLADVLVIAARTRDGSTMEDGVSLFLVPRDTAGVEVKLLPSIDETRKTCEVRLDNAALPATALLGELHQGWAPLARVVDQAAVALSAEMCGAAQRVLDITVDYAKMRTTFGKPIGSYQGVKHKCADMLIEIENAKSLTYYAAWAIDEGDPDAAMGVSMAKAAASDAGRKVCAAGIQLHGGIGMTWEHDLHLYLKRAKADEVALGDATWHRERIARLLGA